MPNRKRKKADLHCEQLETRLVPSCVMPPLPSAAIQTMIDEQNAVLDLVPLTNVTDEAIGGSWSDPHSWKGGVLPGAAANIEIDPGVTEVYDLANSPAYNTIRVDGTLKFSQAKSTSLLVQTIVDMPTGDVEIVEPNPAVRATITIADTGPLDLVGDPKELGRGYLAVGIMNPDDTMGAAATTNLVGAQKDGWETISGIAAGSTSLSFPTAPLGWQVGDKLLFNGTGIGTSADETVAITAISGNTVSFTPLRFDHLTPVSHSGPMTTTVANLTRNVIFQSQVVTPGAPTNFQGRGAVNGVINFSWDPVANATSYEVQQSKDGTTWYNVGDTATNSFSLTGIPVLGSRQFRVIAFHNLDSGAASSIVKAGILSVDPTVPYDYYFWSKFPAAGGPNYVSALRLGHIMFMHTDADTVDYVEIDNMGRTDKSKVLNTKSVDAANGEVVTNVVGRYSLHFHRLYNSSPDCLVNVIGDVVTGGPGWGFDNHSSNVNFQDNIDYGTYGAGFVTEAGDETGSFTHDLAVHNTANRNFLQGHNVGVDGRGVEDYGTGGNGFWIQGKYGISLENNVAAESASAGFWLNGRGLIQGGGFGTTKFWTQNITDPTLIPKGNPVSVSIPSLPLVDFVGNSFEVGNEAVWISGASTSFPGHHDELQNTTAWGVTHIGIENYYDIGFHVVDGATLLGMGTDRLAGINATFGYSSSVEYSNLDIEGFLHGVEVAGKGTNVISNAGYLDNLINFYVQLADTAGTLTIEGSDPQFGQASHAPGGYDYFFQSMGSSNMGHNVDQLDGARFRPWVAFMNTTSHPNEQIYMQSQGWDVNPWISGAIADDSTKPTHFTDFQLAAFSDADKAMTNGEMWQTYGRTVGGYAAPADATSLAGSNVLVAEPQPTLPPYAIGYSPHGGSEYWNSPKYTNQLTGYVAKFSDENSQVVTLPAVNLHEGWNFLPFTHNGYFYSIMVFGDTQPPVLSLDPKQVLSVTLAQLSQPFTVKWTYFDNDLVPTPISQSKTYSNLLGFTLQTRSDGSQFLVIPIVQKDHSGNVTEMDVTINITLV
jgi:hypothetical protein